MEIEMKKIMKDAWRIFYKEGVKFGEALHRAWMKAKVAASNEAKIEAAKKKAGVEEKVDTWYGWKKNGYEVIHGQKCLFQTELAWASKGDGAVYKASFFSESQVAAIAE